MFGGLFMKKYLKLAGSLKNIYSSKELEVFREEKNEAVIEKLQNIFEKSINHEIILICIGTDKSIADSLGPLVGTMLVEKQFAFPVYGTLADPVHASNLKSNLVKIKSQYENPIIIAVDACIGEKDQIGSIIFENGPLLPGIATFKSLPPVGDYQLKVVVNHRNIYDPSYFIHNTRLFTVINLAKKVTNMILDSTNLSNER